MIPMPYYGIDDEIHAPDVVPPEHLPHHSELHPEPPPSTFKAMRIVRAVTGRSEIRLLQAITDGAPSGFAIETIQLSPYVPRRTYLDEGKRDHSMTASDALQAFEETVEQHYPPCKLRNGKSVPTHLNLL